MSKQQWKELWATYRLNLSGSIARTLVKLETQYGHEHEQVALLAKVVLAADDSFAQK